MQQVILTKGIPASGKSTWAKDHVKKVANWKRINRDELRLMIDAGEWSPAHEKFIVEARNELLSAALKKGFNVVIDDTNLRDENWVDVCEIVEKANISAMVMEKCFPIDLETAIERDSRRGSASVGATVITNMWKKNLRNRPDAMRPKTQHFYQRQLPGLAQDETLPKAIICDLDGTLAHIGNRSPYNASLCDVVDTPNVPVVETVRLYHQAGYKIIFVSGREDKDRAPTMRFIAKHLPEVCSDYFHSQVSRLMSAYQRLSSSKTDEKELLELELNEITEKLEKIPVGTSSAILLMRTTDDKRKDTVVKQEIWDRNISGKYNVLCAIDDRSSVVKMWRYEIGLPVFQVAEGNF